jgi:hypothetical protein
MGWGADPASKNHVFHVGLGTEPYFAEGSTDEGLSNTSQQERTLTEQSSHSLLNVSLRILKRLPCLAQRIRRRANESMTSARINFHDYLSTIN